MKIFGPGMKKRGSLQLSINAIVILILAITILGLGLGFIKKQFSSLGEQFESVSAEIKGEIIEKIKTSGELLVFNKIEIDAQVGKPDTFYIGIKNTGSDTNCFLTYLECTRRLGGVCDPDGVLTGPLPVGGKGISTEQQPVAGTEWFKVFSEVDIEGGDVGVFPITMQIPGNVASDTYLLSLKIFKSDSGDCAGAQWPQTDTPYQGKQFYVKISG